MGDEALVCGCAPETKLQRFQWKSSVREKASISQQGDVNYFLILMELCDLS